VNKIVCQEWSQKKGWDGLGHQTGGSEIRKLQRKKEKGSAARKPALFWLKRSGKLVAWWGGGNQLGVGGKKKSKEGVQGVVGSKHKIMG